MKTTKRKTPTWGTLIALVCALVATSAAEAKTTKKHAAVKKAVVTSPAIGIPTKGFKPKAPEYYGYPRPRRQDPREYYINGNIPNAAYYGNTYGYSYGPRTIPYPSQGYQQQASPEYLMKYSQYVQQYNRSNDMPQPYGFAPNTYPSSRYDSSISQKERFERDRVYSAQVALHALLLRYGTREGGDRFPDREKLTQEAIRYADLLRYGMTHTYTNPETNIAP
ncbi:MAG: hypothetical protein K2X29_10870 [Candidatus Obscuribacterales bacterium]|nr:hypothetical protein [Candidatus Obscuribacterales bacterium]